MAATEIRYISFRWPFSELVPAEVGDGLTRVLDYSSSVPQLEEVLDGWEVFASQIIPLQDSFLLVLTLRVVVNAPDTVPGSDGS